MEGHQLTTAFFEVLDSASLDFQVMFEEAVGSRLRLLVDSQAVAVDFSEYQLTCKSSKSPFPQWLEWANSYLSDNAGDIMTGETKLTTVIEALLSKYGEFKDYEDEEFSDHEDEYLEDSEHSAKNAEEVFNARQEERKIREADEKLDAELETKIQALERTFAGAGSATATKRILNEYKYLVKSKECRGINVNFVQDNCYIWQVLVDVDNFDLSPELKADFSSYSARYSRSKLLEYEVRFDSNFPFNPPFVRIVKPRFAFHTGHVTIGGSICMQSLTPSGWIPVRTVESIFIEILFNMAEGGARLDLNSADVSYTLQDAQEAFSRVARHHKWL